MHHSLSRRRFLGTAAAASAVSLFPDTLRAEAAPADAPPDIGFPLVDYHVHIEAMPTLEKLLEVSQRRGVKFGIVEHAGTKENKYPNLISNDEQLEQYLAQFEGQPVFKGVQAEGLDWMTCFSKEMILKLDYVLTDALTLPERDGTRVELWRPWVKVADKQEFMDRYVDFHVTIMAREPIDILANVTFLPGCIAAEHDALWTPQRMQKIIDAAVKYGVAIEINSGYRLPKVDFLRMAKKSGAKFSFGCNIRGPEVGKVDYGIEIARELGLKGGDMFAPAPPGRKPIERRNFPAT